jgi:LPS sulfotransferase NodH
MTPFLIIGQPRSGTTYLQTLLNEHPRLLCRGELFDPWQIDDNGVKTTGLEAVIRRDADPIGFLDAMLAGEGLKPQHNARVLGAKILFQHHPAVFARFIPARPDIRLIHVQRENKLAQFASGRQVAKTGKWTATAPTGASPKIEAAPFWAASECNRMENEDFLLGEWLKRLPNPVLQASYAGLFAPDFATRVQAFLGVETQANLSSPLVKQGQNNILDRFSKPDPIARSFRETGREAWLGPEL